MTSANPAPAITFIIPAHNAAATLGDTLRSLLAQTRRDWFALIIDDGSTDSTSEVAQSFHDPRFRLFNQKNAGVAHARNRGLAMATTPAVCFLDADDTIDPAFFTTMLPAVAGHDLVPAAYRYTGPNLEPAHWTITPSPSDPDRLTEFNQYAIGAIVFNRESLASHSFPTHSRQEDWELLLSLRRARWAPPITAPLFSYRLRPDSRTTALCEIWRDGLNLIARIHPDAAARERALRRWTLRNLARAAVTANLSLCRHLFEHLDTLTTFDVDTLAGALRWSIRRASVAREYQSLQSRPAWHAQILAALSSDDLARESLRRAAAPDWSLVAAAAAARLAPHQTLVIYGAGRNGRDLLSALQSHRIPLAVIDDNPTAPLQSIPRVTVSDLSPRHIVLVTPDDRAAILATLSRAHPAAILLPEQLVA